MPKTIIADTSCFIILTNIGELSLLQKVYGSVITTIEVAAEYGQPFPAIKPLIEKIKKTDFRLSDELELKALKIADE